MKLQIAALLASLLAAAAMMPSCNMTNTMEGKDMMLKNGLCACKDGWTGPTCEICTTKDVCSAKSECVSTTFETNTTNYGWCSSTANNLKSVIGGTGYVDFAVDAVAKNFTFEFYKQAVNATEIDSLFKCHAVNITKVVVGPAVNYTSNTLNCTSTCVSTDKVCSTLKTMTPRIGAKGASFACNNADKSCVVDEALLGTLFQGGVRISNCTVGQCVMPMAPTKRSLLRR